MKELGESSNIAQCLLLNEELGVQSQQNVDNSNGVGIPLVDFQDVDVPVTLDDEGLPLERRQNGDVVATTLDLSVTLDETEGCPECIVNLPSGLDLLGPLERRQNGGVPVTWDISAPCPDCIVNILPVFDSVPLENVDIDTTLDLSAA